MEFDEATYERAVETVRSCMAEVPGHLAQMRSAAVVAASGPLVPAPVGAALLSAADTIEHNAEQILAMVTELLDGVGGPVTMVAHAQRWIDVRGAASDVQSAVRTDQLTVRGHWKGPAAERYATAATGQSPAAGRVAVVAQSTVISLGTCAAAGMLFYLALGVILVRLVVSLVAAIAAFGTEVLSWAGLLLAVEESGVGAALVISAVTALTALLGTEVAAVDALRGDIVDHSQFPGGRWPRAVADTYRDASVVDGYAEWSVVP